MTELLEVCGVSRAFGGIKAVDDVSFTVGPGEWVGIAGPNGAGKSTLLNCISNVAGRYNGTIVFQGVTISGLNPSRISRLGIARAFQTIDGFSDCSGRDFVALGRLGQRSASIRRSVFEPLSSYRKERSAKQAAEELLAKFGLSRMGNVPMRELPYGVRKMIDVLRVLVSEPTILLLDEPTSGSSARERIMLREMMTALRERGVSAVVVDHDTGFLAHCSDRIVAMAEGRKLVEGPPDAVFTNPAVVRSYLGEQTEKKADPATS
jgi:branched-chain amino acid transport system ATP-binding protein